MTGKECIEYRRIAAKEISVLAEAAKPPSQCTCGYKTVFVLTLLRFSFFSQGWKRDNGWRRSLFYVCC